MIAYCFDTYADDYNRVVLDPTNQEFSGDYVNASYVDVSWDFI